MKHDNSALVRIKGEFYRQTNRTPSVGDLVLDTHDCSFGTVDTFLPNGNACVRDGWAVEINIKPSRLRVLAPIGKDN